MEEKYKLTDETINVIGKTLYRIEALKDFGNVKKGDKGGYVEKEENLSQSGDCWICDNAMVYDDAEVFGDAVVFGNVKVCHNAKIYCNAKIYDNAEVFDSAEVFDNAKVSGDCLVSYKAKICGDAQVYGEAWVYGNAKVCDEAEVFDHVVICGDAVIKRISDYILFKNWWSSRRYFTWTRSNNMWKVGCFYGTGEQLIEKAYKDSELSGKEYEHVVKYVETTIINDGKDK